MAWWDGILPRRMFFDHMGDVRPVLGRCLGDTQNGRKMKKQNIFLLMDENICWGTHFFFFSGGGRPFLA